MGWAPDPLKKEKNTFQKSLLCIITKPFSIILALLFNVGRTRASVGVKARLNVSVYGSRNAGTVLKQAGYL